MPPIKMKRKLEEPKEETKKHKLDSDISTVIPNKLFIGNEKAASNFELLKKNNITAILNCSSDTPLFFEKDNSFIYCKIFLEDTHDQKIIQYFNLAHNFISQNKVVFVHCQEGVSRAPSILSIFYSLKKFLI